MNQNLDRWRGFKPRPQINHSSASAGCHGIEFHEITSPPFGTFEPDGRCDGITLAWTLGPLKVRWGNQKHFAEVVRRPRLDMSGDGYWGAWKGVETSLCLNITTDFVRKTLNQSAILIRPKLGDHQLTKIEHLMRLIRSDVQSDCLAGPQTTETMAAHVITILYPDDETSRWREQRDTTGVSVIREYIEANLHDRMNMLDLAAVGGISMRHMSRAFNSAIGYAPHEYVLRRRIERAKELMSTGRLGLTEIAIAVGFSSHSHMSAAFKKITGNPPSHFRNG